VPRPRRIRLTAAAVAIALAGCSSAGDLTDDTPTTEPSPDRPALDQPEVTAERAAPWPDRPVVDLRFDASGSLQTIRGSERVRFIADERVCQLVFRLWANKPALVDAGTELTVDRVRVGRRPVQPAFRSAGAPRSTPGSVMTVPIRCLDPGTSITVTLDFHFTLGPDVGERMGRSDETAWFATAYPLLAWQRDRGWATNPVVRQFGEMASSEEFRLRHLQVVVPESYEVLGTGHSLGRRSGPRAGTAIERFRAESVRDVAVTVGELDVVHREIHGVRLPIGAPVTGTSMSLEDWASDQADAITALEGFLGDFPYADLWVSVLPDVPGGIEFPGAIQYGDADARDPYKEHVIVHETAHMWFYGLVGNNQGTDPWLDESWATYAEERVAGASPFDVAIPDAVENHVGESMVWYSRPDTFGGYGAGVYIQGGEMLRKAMGSVDAEVTDALLQGYINANAHAIATPSDVAHAFSSEPSVVEVLREYGAVD
jgi:Peptidase family M1 domain